MKPNISKIFLIVVALALVVFLARNHRALAPGNEPVTTQQEASPAGEQIVAQDLRIPWEIAFLPDNSLLVTERPGSLLHITPDKTVIPVAGVEHKGEGGLLGLAIHPNFKDNHFIYLYLTTKTGDSLTNRVERYRLADNTLADKKVIIEGIPGSTNHDGGRIKFGPDNNLYITAGDSEQPDLAQDTGSLAGKILRVTDAGGIPADNPFGNAVYSYGHRNPQGLAWDSQGRLWATEHGRSGSQSGYDELNLIERGGNYGWPTIQGDETRAGMHTPVANSGPDTTWAPSGLAYVDGTLIFAGLRGEALYKAVIQEDNKVELSEHLTEKYGRLRTVVVGPDGFLYIATSNTDGRGEQTIKPNDDKIIKLQL